MRQSVCKHLPMLRNASHECLYNICQKYTVQIKAIKPTNHFYSKALNVLTVCCSPWRTTSEALLMEITAIGYYILQITQTLNHYSNQLKLFIELL